MAYEYHIGDIKKGDVVCERCCTFGIKMVALEDGHLEGEYWSVKCSPVTAPNEVILLAVHKDSLHYGPELYLNEIPYNGITYV